MTLAACQNAYFLQGCELGAAPAEPPNLNSQFDDRFKQIEMPIYKQWALASRVPSGIPTEDHFQMNEDHTPDLRKGEILCRALFLSVDPITR